VSQCDYGVDQLTPHHHGMSSIAMTSVAIKTVSGFGYWHVGIENMMNHYFFSCGVAVAGNY